MPFRMDEENQQNIEQTAAPKISGVSTGVDFNVPKGTGKPQTPQQQGPQKSGQYQNIQSYLKANQEQALGMGQNVAANVEQKATQAQQAGQELTTEAPKVGEYKPQEVLTQAQAGTTTAPQKSEYETYKTTGGYSGPQDITGLKGYADYFSKGEAAKTAAEQAGTEFGQQQLLKQTYARPDYSQGANILDQALLAQSEGGRQAIANLGQKYSNLTDVLNAYGTQTSEGLTTAQKQAAQNIAAFQPAEQAAQTAIINPLQERATKTNEEQAALSQRLGQDITDYNLTPETLALYGLTPGQRVFDVNLANYINPAVGQATQQNIATQSELDKYNNLMNFIGANPQALPTKEIGYTPLSVNKEQLAADVAAKQKAFEDFAKQRNYLQSFGYGGQRSGISDIDRALGNYGNWSGVGAAGTNLADYLARGQQAFGYSGAAYSNPTVTDVLGSVVGQSPGEIGAGNFWAASEPAKQALLNQINQDLQAYGYNNTIKGV